MKTTGTGGNRHVVGRAKALEELAAGKPFVEGSLCQVKRRGCREPGWQLTFKVKGKTRTVYVPMDMVEEVKAWIQEYKRVKKRIRKVTTHSLALIHRHVADRRAANRARASTAD